VTKTTKWILVAVLAGAVLIMLVVCVTCAVMIGTSDEKSLSTPGVPKSEPAIEPEELITVEPEVEEPPLVVESADWLNEGYLRYITGTVRNTTDRHYNYVQISIPLYDNAGNQVGTAIDNLGGLKPYGTWKYKAIAFEEGKLTFSPAEVEVTGY